MSRDWKGWLTALGYPATILLPRCAPIILAISGIWSLVRIPPGPGEIGRVLMGTAVVAGYPILSAAWSLDPLRALSIIAGVAVIGMVTALVYRRAGRLSDLFLPPLRYGYPAIVAVNLVDMSLGLPLRVALRSMGVEWIGQPALIKSAAALLSLANWSMAAMVLAFFPYLYATREPASPTARNVRALVAAAVVATVFMSAHQSSMLALIVGAAVYAVAWIGKRAALLLVSGAWLLCVAAMPSLISALITVSPSLTQDMPPSFLHRIVIWNEALKDISQRPWLGAGAGSTRITFRKQQMDRRPIVKQGAAGIYGKYSGIAPHSHNWFLDIWREFGGVGALLAFLLTAGIARRLYAAGDAVSGEEIAFLGVVLGMSAASFGIWAFWYLSVIGLCYAAFGLGRQPAPEQAPARAVNAL